jgi:hypothetical protein
MEAPAPALRELLGGVPAAPMVKREVARYLMVRPVAYEVKACSAGSGSLSWALALED